MAPSASTTASGLCRQEQLLLTHAVVRHGEDSWDLISSVLKKQSFQHDAETCKAFVLELLQLHEKGEIEKLKDIELKPLQDAGNASKALLALEEDLRKLRVKELRAAIHELDELIKQVQDDIAGLEAEPLEEEGEEEEEEGEEEQGEEQEGEGAEGESGDDIKEEQVSEGEGSAKSESRSKSEQQVQPEPRPRGRPRKIKDPKPDEASPPASEKKKGRPPLSSPRSEEHDDDETRREEEVKARRAKLAYLYRAYRIVYSHKYSGPFRKPVTKEEAPDYHRKIKKPMDLQTLKKRLDDGSITTEEDFQRDCMLIFQNGLQYNPKGSDLHTMAATLRDFAKKELESIFAEERIKEKERREKEKGFAVPKTPKPARGEREGSPLADKKKTPKKGAREVKIEEPEDTPSRTTRKRGAESSTPSGANSRNRKRHRGTSDASMDDDVDIENI